MFPGQLKLIYAMFEKVCRQSGVIAGKSGRHMKFPYTFSAKIAQFPFFYYLKNDWVWMYYPLGLLGGFWFFTKCHALSNSESNKRSWAESQMKAAEKEHH